VDEQRRKSRRSVWLHRSLACLFIALTIPAVLWWKTSILFVILLSLATQISTEFGAAAAADDRDLADRLARIEALLTGRGGDMPERLAFSLTTLADAAHAPRPLAGCDRGHLVVNHNSHWAPEAFSADLRTLTCVLVESCDG